MATQRGRFDAPAIAQVYKYQVLTYDVGTTYLVTINTKAVSTIAGGSVNGTAAALLAALQASVISEFVEITWTSNGTDTVIGTAAKAGKPFTAVGSVFGATGTQADTNPTANAGPNVANQAANYVSGSVPAAADTLFLDLGANVLYGLDIHTVTLTELDIPNTYTGQIGNPYINGGSNSTPYIEYRDTYFKISATTINIGRGTGGGSGRIKLNVGSVQTLLNQYNSGQALETGIPSVLFLGTHASNVIEALKGSLGIAFFPGEVATVATLRVGYLTNVPGDVSVICGSGTTLTTIEMSGGLLQTASAVTTMNMNNGEWQHLAGAVTTINLKGGALRYRTGSTITTLAIGSNGIADFSQDMTPRTITNAVTMDKGSKLLDPHGTVTFSGGITLVGCSLSDVTIDIGVGRSLGSIT